MSEDKEQNWYNINDITAADPDSTWRKLDLNDVKHDRRSLYADNKTPKPKS